MVPAWKPEKYDIAIAKYFLGDMPPEQLPDLAVHALEHGKDGNAIAQMAAFQKPSTRDFEEILPAFLAELGQNLAN